MQHKENDWITAREFADIGGVAPKGLRWILLATHTSEEHQRLQQRGHRGMMFGNTGLTYVLRPAYDKHYKTFGYRIGDLLWLPRGLAGNLMPDMLPVCPLGLEWAPYNQDLVILRARTELATTVCCVCRKESYAICCEGSFESGSHFACTSCGSWNSADGSPRITCPAHGCTSTFLAHNFVFDVPDTRPALTCPVCKTVGDIQLADLWTLRKTLDLVYRSKDYGHTFDGSLPLDNPMSFLRCSIRLFTRHTSQFERISTFFKTRVRQVLLGMFVECYACKCRFCPICEKSHWGRLCYEKID
jgi:hypothetical protein